ncbi:putative PAP2 superfamily C-terminal [Leishmania shawi]|uniref:PAP2 superfamily C-terminal n=1 Tax=Leishmania shawi TaxID=5680 RepID=A0AAW3BCK1_9TRYP
MPSHEKVHVPGRKEDDETSSMPWYKQPLPLTTQVMRFALLLPLTALFLGVAIVITNGRMPDPKRMPPLPDLLLEWIPKVEFVEIGTDIIILLLNATMVVVGFKVYLLERHEQGMPSLTFLERIPRIGTSVNRVVFGILDSGRRPYPLKGVLQIMVVRFLTSYSVVVLFRALVIVATSYPATDNHCQHPQAIEDPVVNVILTLVTLGSASIHCGDLMFSGHTMILCLAFMLIWDYSPFLYPWAMRVWASVLLPASFYCILASRSHYTDDILVAMYVMIATYKLISHAETGAPWQLQLLIRWLPWPGTNTTEGRWPTDEVVVVVHMPAQDESAASSPMPEYEGVTKTTVPVQSATARSSGRDTHLLRMKDSSESNGLHPDVCETLQH